MHLSVNNLYALMVYLAKKTRFFAIFCAYFGWLMKSLRFESVLVAKNLEKAPG
jgi:hypothetical protein